MQLAEKELGRLRALKPNGDAGLAALQVSRSRHGPSTCITTRFPAGVVGRHSRHCISLGFIGLLLAQNRVL